MCGSKKQLKIINDRVAANLWNGAKWQVVVHGRKRCKDCSASHRLSYVWANGVNICTMDLTNNADATDSDPIMLLESNLGFMWSYLKQLSIRVFRGQVSLQAEACTILMTWPDSAPMGEKRLEEWLVRGLFAYLIAQEGQIARLDLGNPSPDADSPHYRPNTGFHTIFRADVHDHGFSVGGPKRHVAFDGNQVLVRSIHDPQEGRLRKRGRGMPKRSHPQKRRGSSRAAVQPSRQSPSRFGRGVLRCKSAPADTARIICPYVNTHDPTTAVKPNLKKTEGIFATLDMKTGEILHMGEMLNAECTLYKRTSLEEVTEQSKVGTVCHDCACQLASFEGVLCDRVLLDGLKYKKHKCKPALFHPFHKNNVRRTHGLNTQVVEQLWSKTNRLAPIASNMRRERFRLFLRAYCVWRNTYIRHGFRLDTNPCMSAKRVRKHFVMKQPKKQSMKRRLPMMH